MLRPIACLLVCSLVCLACGDDDDDATDGGPRSGRGDGGARDAGGSRPERDAGAVVMLDPDAGALPPLESCPAGACDLGDPDSCGADEGCVFPHGGDAAPSAGPQCAAVGSAGDGESCMRSSDCSFGLDCTAFDGTGVCRQYCCNLARTEGCPDGQFCSIGLSAGGKPSGAALCDVCDGCDPNKNSCGTGRACYPLPGAPDCTACLPAGTKKPGSTCTVSTDCAADSACFRLADKTSRCIQFCNPTTAPTCPSTKKCTVVDTELPKDLGLCL